MTAFTLLLPVLAAAQAYPSRPIRLIVPFPPGGTIDMVGRMVAQGVGDRIGQTMVVDMSTWHTVCATRGTPAAIVNRLNREIVAVINTPGVRTKFATAGTEPKSGTPEQLAAHIAREFPRWEKLLAQLGLRGK